MLSSPEELPVTSFSRLKLMKSDLFISPLCPCGTLTLTPWVPEVHLFSLKALMVHMSEAPPSFLLGSSSECKGPLQEYA